MQEITSGGGNVSWKYQGGEEQAEWPIWWTQPPFT